MQKLHSVFAASIHVTTLQLAEWFRQLDSWLAKVKPVNEIHNTALRFRNSCEKQCKERKMTVINLFDIIRR